MGAVDVPLIRATELEQRLTAELNGLTNTIYTQDMSGKWGEDVDCGDDAVITTSCGGGNNGDCDGHWTAVKCAKYDFANEGTEWRSTQFHCEMLECFKGAMTGACTSGRNTDCDDFEASHKINCSFGFEVDNNDC